MVAVYTALKAAADQFAAAAVADATAPLQQQITVLQGQLTASQALASQEAGQLTAAQQQLAQAQTALAAAVSADQTDRATIAAQQKTIADLQAQVAAVQPGKAPAPPAGWVEAFRDDFTGKAGPGWTATTDAAKNELSQRLPANVVVGPYNVSLQAKRQTYGTRQFTSGYLTTAGHASWDFFRVLIRARWDDLFGLWPALWLRFDNALGEIDIMEAVGTVRKVVETVHQSTNGDMDKSGFEWPMPAGWSPSDWHVYGLERQRDTGTLLWTIDGQTTRIVTPADLGARSHQPMTWLTGPTFTGPAHLIMNMQVGGSMPNYYLNNNQPIDPAKILPGSTVGSLDVDYVQVLTPLA